MRVNLNAVTREELFLEGEYLASPHYVKWVKRIVLATGETALSDWGRQDARPEHEMLGLPIREYHDLPWTTLWPDPEQPKGIQVKRDQQRVVVTTPSHEMAWKAPEGDILAVSGVADRHLLIGTSAKITLLELRPNERTKSGSRGRWYEKLCGGGDGRDWHVKCENCGYEGWFELRQGDVIPKKCPSCAY